jgi:hypothetical protein
MNIKKLETEIERLNLGRPDLDRFLTIAGALKEKAIVTQNESLANKLWVYEAIIITHRYYVQAFALLKRKKYVEGWNLLERAEIEISFVKKHIHLLKENNGIRFIENMVTRFQMLFPYRLFMSSELLEKEITCNICRQIITVRRPCGHRVGELYMGELCLREVTKCEVLGIAMVENPVNKYSQVFNESEDKDFRDNVQFQTLNYILDLVKGPYDQWRLEVSEKLFPHTDYPDLKADDNCPCESGEKYSSCCLHQPGIRGFDYQFRVSDNAFARDAQRKKK